MLIRSNVELSKHALLQIGFRHISIQDIIHCIDKPDHIIEQADNRFRVVKQHNEQKQYVLVVVCEQQAERTIVVTAFITSKVKKYL